ncbi:MAG: clostripain-related cysteine peptidase [Thermoplasmata archaeon]
MKTVALFFAVLLILSSVIYGIFSLHKPAGNAAATEEEVPAAEWTVLFYMCGDNNLGDYRQFETNIHFLQTVGSTDKMNLVVLNDQNKNGDTKAYYIEKREDGQALANLTEIPLSEINPAWTDEVDMGDWKSLAAFAEWGFKKYPAKKLNLFPQNHGGGWIGICWDDTSGTHISVPQLATAMQNITTSLGRKIDVLSMEACLMASTEVVYELYGTCDYYVACETYGYGAEDHGNGNYLIGNWQFDKLYSWLKENPECSPKELAKAMVDTFQEYGPWRSVPYIPKEQSSDCISAMDVNKVNTLVEAIDNVSSALISVLPLQRTRLSAATGVSESFSGQLDYLGQGTYTLYDLVDLMINIVRAFPYNSALKTSVETLVLASKECILWSRCGTDPYAGEHPDAHGLSIYFPVRGNEYRPSYEDLKFSKDTQWDEVIKAFLIAA